MSRNSDENAIAEIDVAEQQYQDAQIEAQNKVKQLHRVASDEIFALRAEREALVRTLKVIINVQNDEDNELAPLEEAIPKTLSWQGYNWDDMSEGVEVDE